LETLSSVTILAPGVLSIFTDAIRALLFPWTMIFGPFVNDAVAQLGKVGSVEISKMGEHCTSVKQEIEADVVSARSVHHLFTSTISLIEFPIIDSLPTQDSMRAKLFDSGKTDKTTRTQENARRLVLACLQILAQTSRGG